MVLPKHHFGDNLYRLGGGVGGMREGEEEKSPRDDRKVIWRHSECRIASVFRRSVFSCAAERGCGI